MVHIPVRPAARPAHAARAKGTKYRDSLGRYRIEGDVPDEWLVQGKVVWDESGRGCWVRDPQTWAWVYSERDPVQVALRKRG